MSSRITCFPSFVLPILERSDWADDIANYLRLSGHVVEDIVDLIFCGNQLHYGFAVFGDDDGFSALRYLIHNREAMRLELASGNLFHTYGHNIVTMG